MDVTVRYLSGDTVDLHRCKSVNDVKVRIARLHDKFSPQICLLAHKKPATSPPEADTAASVNGNQAAASSLNATSTGPAAGLNLAELENGGGRVPSEVVVFLRSDDMRWGGDRATFWEESIMACAAVEDIGGICHAIQRMHQDEIDHPRGMHGEMPNAGIDGEVPNAGIDGEVPNAGIDGEMPGAGVHDGDPNDALFCIEFSLVRASIKGQRVTARSLLVAAARVGLAAAAKSAPRIAAYISGSRHAREECMHLLTQANARVDVRTRPDDIERNYADELFYTLLRTANYQEQQHDVASILLSTGRATPHPDGSGVAAVIHATFPVTPQTPGDLKRSTTLGSLPEDNGSNGYFSATSTTWNFRGPTFSSARQNDEDNIVEILMLSRISAEHVDGCQTILTVYKRNPQHLRAVDALLTMKCDVDAMEESVIILSYPYAMSATDMSDALVRHDGKRGAVAHAISVYMHSALILMRPDGAMEVIRVASHGRVRQMLLQRTELRQVTEPSVLENSEPVKAIVHVDEVDNVNRDTWRATIRKMYPFYIAVALVIFGVFLRKRRG